MKETIIINKQVLDKLNEFAMQDTILLTKKLNYRESQQILTIRALVLYCEQKLGIELPFYLDKEFTIERSERNNK